MTYLNIDHTTIYPPRDDGTKVVRVTLTPQHQSDLSAIMDSMGLTQAEAICWAIGKAVGR
jgi:hypothetical protein